MPDQEHTGWNRTPPQNSNLFSATANQAMEQAKTMARDIGEQARSAARDSGATAQDLARQAREQATAAAGDALYRRGQRAGEYLTQSVNEYPLTALLAAGMIGYGLAYLIHTQWQSQTSWHSSGMTGPKPSFF
jgi:vacuolar-type H+-ATPase subunit H